MRNTGGTTTLSETQATVVQLLRRGMASRAELAEQCGITPAAMSMTIRHLVEAGIILEGERRRGGRGAPQIDLTLNPNVGYALGVHATMHEISLALLDYRGSVMAETRMQGSFINFADVCDIIQTLSEKLRIASGIPFAALLGAGIAMPTRFHSKASGLDLAQEIVAWAGNDLTSALEQSLGCPVYIENDANAAALGELSLGNVAGYSDFSYLYLSEGIGSGLVMNGCLYRGHLGNAGEAGALRPRGISRPSFEDLMAFYRENGLVPPERTSIHWNEFLETYQPITEEWLQRALTEVRQIASILTSIIAPAAIFIGGTLPVQIRHIMAERMNADFNNYEGIRCAYQPDFVIPAIEAQDAVAFGAAASVLHRV